LRGGESNCNNKSTRKRKRKHIYDFMGYFETEPIVFFSERKGVFGFRRRAFWPGRL
jgi:hypothetical protein